MAASPVNRRPLGSGETENVRRYQSGAHVLPGKRRQAARLNFGQCLGAGEGEEEVPLGDGAR
jgi:hypothetical protein